MYNFSLTWFFIGLVVTGIGIAFVRFYKEVADNMGSGVPSYERYKLFAFGVCVAGILMTFNLHTLVIEFVGNLVFGGMIKK